MEIQGNVSAMMMDKNASDPDFKYLSNIGKTVKNATNLTRDLLGFARGGSYELCLADLNELVHNEDMMFGSTKKEVFINETLQDGLWPAKVDQGQIQQVLMNLYVNAVQAMPESGGKIAVRTENIELDEDQTRAPGVKPGAYVKIRIEDNGCGMPETEVEKIFEPFYTTKKPGVGTGLGLSSAYGIIKNHGGFITVSSEEGSGTVFDVYLPAEPGARVEKEKDTPRKSDAIEKGTECILVVDDERMVANACLRMLKRLGYRGMVAHSGEEAVSVYENHHKEIDLVLLDMLMPGTGGGETYDKLKAVNPRVRVLLSSGFNRNSQARDILAKGCSGFIQKPYDLHQLSAKLREILDKKINTA